MGGGNGGDAEDRGVRRRAPGSGSKITASWVRGVHRGRAPSYQGRVQAFAERTRSCFKAVDAGDRFDLYVLDVIMPEPGGIQTGLKLRNAWERAARSST